MDLHGVWISKCQFNVFTFYRNDSRTLHLSTTQYIPAEKCSYHEDGSASADILWFCCVYQPLTGVEHCGDLSIDQNVDHPLYYGHTDTVLQQIVFL